jgi:hypothetical protein
MISGAVIIGEEHQLCLLDLFLNSRWSSDLNEDKKSALKRKIDLKGSIQAWDLTIVGSRRTCTHFKV